MVKYDHLWETMQKKKVTQYRLIRYYGVSAGQIGRLKHNMHVSTHTLEMLCSILDCSVEEIIEIIPEKIEPAVKLPKKEESKHDK